MFPQRSQKFNVPLCCPYERQVQEERPRQFEWRRSSLFDAQLGASHLPLAVSVSVCYTFLQKWRMQKLRVTKFTAIGVKGGRERRGEDSGT